MKSRFKEILAPLIFMILFIIGWDLSIRIFDINKFTLPSPSAVLESLSKNFNELFSAGLNSFLIAGAGFILSLILGILVGLIMSQSRIIERSLYPYAIFLQCVPIVALAPLIILWFGYGVPAMIIISFIISLFPIITSTVNGLTSIKKDYLDLMKLYNASSKQILFKVRFPSAVPYIITGAKVSAGLSVVGAIIGEYFAGLSGRSRGLAYLIRSTEQNADFPYMFATIIAAAVLGLVIFSSTSIISNIIIKKRSFSGEALMRLLLLFSILFITSCNQKKEDSDSSLTKVKLQLNWMPEAEHGGYYEALLKGLFKEEGLDVEILPGGPGVKVETETALERVEFGIANADKILIVRDKDMKICALMSPYEKSPRCLIFHSESGIQSFKDLTKAEVLILNNTKPYYHWLRKLYPDIADKDTIPYNKATFMSNKKAVIQGYINSEPLIFKSKGLDVKALNVSETGFNPYTSVLICSENLKSNKSDLVEKMKRASVKGWLSYLKNPQETNTYIEKINPANKGTLNESTEELQSLMSSQDENFGKMSLDRWKKLAEQMIEIKLISQIPEKAWDFVD